jgi:hypothetical protein
MQHASSPTSPSVRRRVAAALSAVLVVLATFSLGAPHASARPSGSPGTLSAGAYDYLTDQPADVVVGDPDTNLVITFTARRALDDGTMTVSLPGRDWPDPLLVGDRLHPDDPTLRGAVVVRPSETYDELTDADCRAAEGQTLGVEVANGLDSHTATVSHLSCAAGQSVTLRVFDVQAPRSTGTVRIAATVRDAAGGTADALPVRVRPVPTTWLALQPTEPISVQTFEPVAVTITALTTQGSRTKVDTGYRGTVNVIPVGTDCFVDVAGAPDITFTAADRGVKTVQVTFRSPDTFRLEAYDVARRARTGYGTPVEVAASPDYEPNTCSRAYH